MIYSFSCLLATNFKEPLLDCTQRFEWLVSFYPYNIMYSLVTNPRLIDYSLLVIVSLPEAIFVHIGDEVFKHVLVSVKSRPRWLLVHISSMARSFAYVRSRVDVLEI